MKNPHAPKDMTTPDAPAVSPILGPARLVIKMLGNASLLLPTLYVLGFIYLKTFLAHFGIEIELASLSVTNLLLAHRFCATLDFFVIAGALQAYLVCEIHSRGGLRGLRTREYFAAGVVVIFPFLLTTIASTLALWTEKDVPKGFNPSNLRLLLPLSTAWVAGIALTLFARYLVRTRKWTFSYGFAVVCFLAIVGLAVFSYRHFAVLVARDKDARNDYQTLIFQDAGAGSRPVPRQQKCKLLYADTQSFFFLCEGRRVVYARDSLKAFEVQ